MQRIIMLISGWLIATPLWTAQAQNWEPAGIDNGVKVFRKEIPGNPFVGFKGIKKIPLPMAQVGQLLLDQNTENRKQWVDRVQEFVFLEYSPRRAVFYSSYGLPWPISDRDYVIESELAFNDAKREMIVTLKSVPHPEAPETVGVRAIIEHSRYRLKAISATETLAEVEILTDPRGNLPAWLVNLIQESWPANTLNSMAEFAARPNAPAHPMLLEKMKQWRTRSAQVIRH